jgi:hypothetical protein
VFLDAFAAHHLIGKSLPGSCIKWQLKHCHAGEANVQPRPSTVASVLGAPLEDGGLANARLASLQSSPDDCQVRCR